MIRLLVSSGCKKFSNSNRVLIANFNGYVNTNNLVLKNLCVLNNQLSIYQCNSNIRSFSTNNNNNEKSNEDKPKSTYSIPKNNNNSWLDITVNSLVYAKDNIILAYKELTGEIKPSLLKTKLDINTPYKKKEGTDDDDDEISTYDGPTSLVAVKENLNPWDQMKERLQNSTFIRNILKGSEKIAEIAGNTTIGKQASQVKETVQDKIEDIREIWETSQNPIIYTLSGVWENMTSETEEAMTVSAIKKLDANFRKEDWLLESQEKLAAPLIKSHLLGDIKNWKSWLGEGVYSKLSADIRARKQDGYVFDSNILNIENQRVVLKLLDNGRPVIVVVYMVQQINCIRNRAGEIIEGSESELRAKFYSMAYEQHYDDETGEVMWKIIDYEFVGDLPYSF